MIFPFTQQRKIVSRVIKNLRRQYVRINEVQDKNFEVNNGKTLNKMKYKIHC